MLGSPSRVDFCSSSSASANPAMGLWRKGWSEKNDRLQLRSHRTGQRFERQKATPISFAKGQRRGAKPGPPIHPLLAGSGQWQGFGGPGDKRSGLQTATGEGRLEVVSILGQVQLRPGPKGE